jgi:hypothetical protein
LPFGLPTATESILALIQLLLESHFFKERGSVAYAPLEGGQQRAIGVQGDDAQHQHAQATEEGRHSYWPSR